MDENMGQNGRGRMAKWTNKWAKMDEETRPFFFIFAVRIA